MKKEAWDSLKSFLVEVLVYAALVVGYFFLVLTFLGGWLDRLYESDRPAYAAVALGLIVGQGILLNGLTQFLLALLKPRPEDK